MLAVANMGLISFSLCPLQLRLSLRKRGNKRCNGEGLSAKELMRREACVGAMVAHGKGAKRWTFTCLARQGKWPWHRTLGLKEHLFKETEAKRGSDDLPGH
jgi:hypothetical protein